MRVGLRRTPDPKKELTYRLILREVPKEGHTNGMLQVYITRLSDQNHLRATWDGRMCEFDASFARSDDPLPHFGPFTCKAVVTP